MSSWLLALAACAPLAWASSAAAESGAHRQPPPPPDVAPVTIAEAD